VARGRTGAGAVAGISEVSVRPAGVAAGGSVVAAGTEVATVVGVVAVTTAATLASESGDRVIGRGSAGARGKIGTAGSTERGGSTTVLDKSGV